MHRRRSLAYSAPLPPRLAAYFTVGELAALRIIGDECRDRGRCDIFIDEIAARAGVSRSTVQKAMRKAVALGIISKTERRITGTRNDSNLLAVTSAEWLIWLHRRGKTGFKLNEATDTRLRKEALRGRKSQNLGQGP